MKRFKDWKPPVFDEDGYAYSFDSIKRYDWSCLHFENLRLGDNVDIGRYTLLNAQHGISIGENTQIGPHCTILTANTENETYGAVSIGKNVLIGAYCLVLPHAIISDGSKIRAYSIVKPKQEGG